MRIKKIAALALIVGLASFFVPPAEKTSAAVSLLQNRTAKFGDSASHSLAFLSNVAAGSSIVVAVGTTQAVTGVTDNQGNVYSEVVSLSATRKAAIWLASNVAGGAVTVTMTTASLDDSDMSISEWNAVLMVDAFASAAQATGTSHSTGSVTNSTTEAVAVAASRVLAGFTHTVNGDYNQLGVTTRALFQYRILSGIATSNATWMSGANVDVTSVHAVFKVSGGGGPAPVCGNGVVEGAEQCDGANLNSKTCTTQGFAGGTLSCTANCTFNTSQCTNPVPDTTPPTVALTAPANGATVSGTIAVSANASDNVGVVGVQFKLDSANLGAEDTSSPYSVSWNTAAAANGSHALTAVARDAAWNTATTSTVTITVNNASLDTTPPSTPTNLAATAVSSSQINLSWTASTDNVGVTGYKIFRSGTQIATSAATNYSDTGLTPSTTYTYTVSAFDAAGNNSPQSAQASAVTLAAPVGGTMNAASRTSGVAPLAVFFDVVETQGTVGTGVVQASTPEGYADYHYEWDFGDPASGAWRYGRQNPDGSRPSKNEAIGYVAAHVFETPGTYTVNLTVTEPSGAKRAYQQAITVTAFAGTTYCYSTSGNFSGCPAGATQKTSSVFNEAMNDLFASNGPRQVLFRRGETFSATGYTRGSGTGPFIIGAYGAGAKPLVRNSGSSVTLQFYSGLSDVRIVDVDFQGPYPGSTAEAGIAVASNMLLLRSRITGHWVAVIYSGPRNDRSMIVDSELVANQDYGVFYYYGKNIALLGNYVEKYGTGGHLVRTYATHSIVGNNSFLGGAPGRHQLKFVGYKPGQVPPFDYVEYSLVSDNAFLDAGPVGWQVTIGPQDDISDERIRNVIVERNLFQTNENTSVALYLNNEFNTVRNNVFDGRFGNPTWGFVGVNITRRGIEPPPRGHKVYNNTFYRAEAAVRLERNAPTDITIINNLADSAGLSTPNGAAVLIDGTGSGLVANNNLLRINPGFTSVSGGNFRLLSTSPAVNAGASVPVFEDFEGTKRPQGLAWDIGAFEFTGSTPPPGNDVTPPTVSITVPAAGATVSGAVAVAANASDPIVSGQTTSNVAGVQFKLDGVNLGAESTVAPYAVSWDTTLSANGAHTLTAVARDNAGLTSTSAAVGVTVGNVISDKFVVGDRVRATDVVSVRSLPSLSGTSLGTRAVGDLGTVVSGPVSVDGYVWWNINYDVNPDGWSVENWLEKYVAPTTYTIAATASVGGAITPSGLVTVTAGNSQTFVIAPSNSYQIASVVVDGTSVGAVPTYTFPNVAADHVISASFGNLPPSTSDITIDGSVGYQAMDGMGAASYNFPYANDIGWNWDAVKFVYDELNIRYVRTAPWFNFWEPTNDNADPNVINWNGFGTINAISAWHDLPYAKYLTSKGIEVNNGVWNVADWLANGSPRQISTANYPELGETIASYIRWMNDNGVPITVTEVQNEPAIDAAIRYPSPEALRDAALQLISQLDKNGLSNVNLHGPNYHTPVGAAAWAQVWLANPTLRDRTEAVSYHTWWSTNFNDYDSIRQVAEQYNKPVWVTEDGLYADSARLLPETWTTAWDFAQSIYRAIAWSHATRVYHWTVLGNDALVSKTGERYPTFYTFKHFSNFIPPGAVLVNSSSPDSEVTSLAFRLPNGNYSFIALNSGNMNKAFNVAFSSGGPFRLVESYTTTNGSYYVPGSPQEPTNGKISVSLPAKSITSATFSSVSGSTDTTPPTVSLTAPAAGATVSAAVAVAANATDPIVSGQTTSGIAGVQFKLDGANLGAESTVAPYAVSWDTTLSANGAHTLTAVARDNAGLTSTSAAVGVTVSNVVAPTTYTIAATASVGGAITPSGLVAVTTGNSQTFTIAPSSGYQIASVVVDGTSVGAVSTYTFPNVAADHVISASFAVVTVCAENWSCSPWSACAGGAQTRTCTDLNNCGTTASKPPTTQTCTVTPIPVLAVSPAALSFSAQAGGGNPASQTLTVANSNGGTLVWSAADDASWLTLAPISGSGNGVVAVSVNLASLSIGNYTANVTVTATGANGSPQIIPVSLAVNPTSDTGIPIISSITVSDITSTTATVNWLTNEPSTSQVEYGFTASYGQTTTLDLTLVSRHSQTLSGLSPNTVYHYRVHSRDAAGNAANSIDLTFTTLAAPVSDTAPPQPITDFKVVSTDKKSTVLSWTAPYQDETAANSGPVKSYDLRYGRDPITETGWETATPAPGLPTPAVAGQTETYTLVDLSPGKTYYAVLRSADATGNVSSLSNLVSIATKNEPPPPSGGGGGGSSGGGGGTASVRSTVVASPATVTVQPADRQILLAWQNPVSPDFVRVLVLRSFAPLPAITTPGNPRYLPQAEAVYDGSLPRFTDVNLMNGQLYYYTLYAYDRFGRYSSPVTVEIRPIAGGQLMVNLPADRIPLIMRLQQQLIALLKQLLTLLIIGRGR